MPKPLPTPEQARQGAVIAADNANDLLTAARAVHARQLHGPACSLLVLALEEAVKARVLIDSLISDYFDLTTEQFRAVVYGQGTAHSLRHRIAFIETQMVSVEVLVRLLTKGAGPTRRQQARLRADLAALDWYTEANSLKKGGLYANFEAPHWRGPRTTVDVDHYRRALALVSPFIKNALRQVQRLSFVS